MDSSDLSAEYANIKNYCRKEAAKSFKHPMAPKNEAVAAVEDEPSAESELTDAELEAMLAEE